MLFNARMNSAHAVSDRSGSSIRTATADRIGHPSRRIHNLRVGNTARGIQAFSFLLKRLHGSARLPSGRVFLMHVSYSTQMFGCCRAAMARVWLHEGYRAVRRPATILFHGALRARGSSGQERPTVLRAGVSAPVRTGDSRRSVEPSSATSV